MDDVVLHLRGRVLTGPDEADEAGEAWVVGGRVTFEEPTAPAAAADVVDVEGWVLPGLVDAHCHIGIDPDGGVDAATTERFATADRDAGALLLRDPGTPGDRGAARLVVESGAPAADGGWQANANLPANTYTRLALEFTAAAPTALLGLEVRLVGAPADAACYVVEVRLAAL